MRSNASPASISASTSPRAGRAIRRKWSPPPTGRARSWAGVPSSTTLRPSWRTRSPGRKSSAPETAEGSSMLASRLRLLLADPDGALALIRRLLLEHAAGRWKRYGRAFALMAVTAACTAILAYLIKDFVNETYIGRDFHAIVALGIATMALYAIKGASTYGHTVALARINSRIIADIQEKTFDKLLNQGLGYFADRHSTEFIARLTAGTTAVTQVLNLLILALGRDLLTLIGLAIVMISQDPILFFIGFITVPPAMLVLRKLIRRIRVIAHNQFTGGSRILETMQEAVQGIRIVKSFTLEEQMRARFTASVAEVERESNQMALA